MPALASIVIFGIQELIKESPHLISEFQEIFNKETITPADWDAIRQKAGARSYRDMVPNTDLPAGEA